MSQSKQGNWRERDIQMRSAYYEAGHGKEGLLVEEKAGARPQVGHDLVCLQKGSMAGTEMEWERGSQEDRDDVWWLEWQPGLQKRGELLRARSGEALLGSETRSKWSRGFSEFKLVAFADGVGFEHWGEKNERKPQDFYHNELMGLVYEMGMPVWG